MSLLVTRSRPRLIETVVTSAPSAAILTTAAVKTYLNVTTSGSDTLIALMIDAAESAIEKFLRRALITQTVSTKWEASALPLRILRPPVQSLSAVTTSYEGSSSVEASLAAFFVGGSEMRPELRMKDTGDFTESDIDEVWITTVNGYGDAATDLPPDIVQAARLVVSQFYDRRDDWVKGGVTELSFAARRLLTPYQIPLI